jgi:hypothetical protein
MSDHSDFYCFWDFVGFVLPEFRPPASSAHRKLLKIKEGMNGLLIAITIAPVMFRLLAGGPHSHREAGSPARAVAQGQTAGGENLRDTAIELKSQKTNGEASDPFMPRATLTEWLLCVQRLSTAFNFFSLRGPVTFEFPRPAPEES